MANWFDMEIASLDTETTSTKKAEARIIEVGIVCFRQGEKFDEYDQLVNPGMPIPEEVTELTGIRDEDVADKPSFGDIADNVLKYLNNRIFLAYNAPYDLGVLEEEFKRLGRELPTFKVIDPLVLAREVLGLRSYKLGLVAEHLGISMERAHRATDDATAAAEVLYRIKDRLPEDLDELLQLQQQWYNAQETAWRNRMRARGQVFDEVIPKNDGEQDFQLRLGPAYAYSRAPNPDPLLAFIRDFASRVK